MPDPLKEWLRGEPEKRPQLSMDERRALSRLRKEAKQAGAVLRNHGRGGLSPSLALGVFRRDGFQCKVHGDRGEGENGGLGLHHKGGTGLSAWLRSKGNDNNMNNLVVVCQRAHGDIHEESYKIDETEAERRYLELFDLLADNITDVEQAVLGGSLDPDLERQVQGLVKGITEEWTVTVADALALDFEITDLHTNDIVSWLQQQSS